MNLIFAAVAFTGGALLRDQPSQARPRLDIPGVLLVSGAVFCLVYGFSNAATHSWHTPSTYGFIAAGVVLLAAFAAWQGRSAHPLLPPRVVLDRNRGGAYLSMLIAGAGLFGRQALTALALAHGCDTAFWWTAGIFAAGAVVAGVLCRPGPLTWAGSPVPGRAQAPTVPAKTDT